MADPAYPVNFPNVPLVDSDGNCTAPWLTFLASIFGRTGNGPGVNSVTVETTANNALTTANTAQTTANDASDTANTAETDVVALTTVVAKKANIDSPTFTGTVTVPILDVTASLSLTLSLDTTYMSLQPYAAIITNEAENAIVGYVHNNNHDYVGDVSGVLGYGRSQSGNTSAIRGIGEVTTIGGVVIGGQFQVRNLTSSTSISGPPLAIGVQITGGGTAQNAFGLSIEAENGPGGEAFNTAINITAASSHNGILIASNGNGIPLQINTVTAMQPAAVIIDSYDQNFISRFRLMQNGDVFLNTMELAALGGADGILFTGTYTGSGLNFTTMTGNNAMLMLFNQNISWVNSSGMLVTDSVTSNSIRLVGIGSSFVQMESPMKPPQYTNATLPNAANLFGALIYNTDVNSPQYSNGTIWVSV